jgi:hypothetical protein
MKGVQRLVLNESLHLDMLAHTKCGRVAYKIQLSPKMGAIFLVFHVYQLKKCLRMPEERVEIRGIKLKSDLVDEEKPVYVLDHIERVT